MPSQGPPGNDKQYNLQWVHIDDFSSGCWDGSHISTTVPTLGTAPLGAADITATYACASIPGGALGPLPAATFTHAFSGVGGLPGSATSALIAGFVVTPQLADGSYEIVTVVEADDGTHHYVKATSFLALGAVLNTITGPTETVNSTPGFFGAPYPAFTRMNTTGTGNPPPKLVFPTAVLTDTNGASGNLWVYSSIGTPGSFLADNLITPGSSNTGQIITYGNRVIAMAGLSYTWPAGGGISTNENFNYTDPPESNAFGNQQTILSIENPWGYGAFGTISVGELLFVKKYGGGLILNGDINTPSSVIRIPGIQSTGDFVGRAGSTPVGLVYCSQNQGAWVWNGGNTSTKISRNIADDFFDLETGNITSNNYGFYCEHWQKWVMFSNNMALDTETNAWWKWFPNKGTNVPSYVTGANLFWYVLTQNANQMLAAPLIVNSNSDPWYLVFDNTVASLYYQWQSLPIHVVKNADRSIDVRQVVVRASDPTNTGNAQIKLSVGLYSDTIAAGQIGVNPTPLRFNIGAGAQELSDIVIQIAANNPTGSAPIIHSIDIGYVVRHGEPVVN